MRLVAILFSIILSSCASTPAKYHVVPVLVPTKDYSGTVKRASIIQCPRPVQVEVFTHLKSRDDYISRLLSVISIHNGGGNDR